MRLPSPRFSIALLGLVVACGGAVDAETTRSDAAADGDASGADATPRDTATSSDTAIVTDVPAIDTAPTDTGASLTSTCAAAGGKYCTAQRWELCPIGYEPIGSGDGHYDCGSIQGWCCVLAPASTCSSSGKGNCVPGAECTGCWGKASDTSLTCESGRSCCVDMCD